MTIFDGRLDGQEKQIVQCREYGEIDVATEQVLRADGTLRIPDAVLKNYVNVDFKDGALRLMARGYSGLFELTDTIVVQVRPRFPLVNLSRMVSACGYAPTALPAMRTYRTTNDWDRWMLDLLTDSFLLSVEVISEQGLLRRYRRRSDDSSYPHGRIEMRETVNRFAARGTDHRAAFSWFERTTDTPPNRCLRAATLRLFHEHQQMELSQNTRRRISRLANSMRLFRDVSDDRRHRFLDDEQVRGSSPLPEARAYYRSALDLAVAILSGQGLNLDAGMGPITAGSLMIKTEDLFESFVRLSLQEHLSGTPGLQVLDGNVEPGRRPLHTQIDKQTMSLPPHVMFASTSDHDVAPDILVSDSTDHFPLVADVKYTKVAKLAKRSEIEQVVVYGVRYSSPVAVTIHPRSANTHGGLVIHGQIGKVLVAHYRVDLSAEDLDAEMKTMAYSLLGLIEAIAGTS